jgi:proteasome lid subunit RPN8/RPN11
LSYVSIWKPVHDQIVNASHNAQNEIIGLLVGKLENDTIIINDSVTGEFQAERHRVTLPAETLAKIADDIVRGRLKGSIVGWYHSHVEGGLFLSDTDIQTQKSLQQFSPLVTAMVVDSNTGNVGYFRVDPRSGRQIRIADPDVIIFEELSEAVPPERTSKPLVRATPTIEIRGRPTPIQQPTQRLAVAVLLIALALSIVLLGVLFFRPGAPVGLAIVHTPVLNAAIGTPIDVIANVTGNPRTVSLFYSTIQSNTFVEAEMSSRGSSEFAYTIPGDKVTGNMEYYIKALDSLGNQQQTATYTIPVGDFSISLSRPTLTVYRNNSASITLGIQKINNFEGPISLSATGVPQAVSVSFTPNPIPSGNAEATMKIMADPNAGIGIFAIALSGAYAPSQGPQVVRPATIQITVTDFVLQASPSSVTVSIGGTATYSIIVTTGQGFTDPVQVTLQGLPQGATYQILTSGTTATVGGTGTTTLTLRIITTQSIRPGSYALTITATSAGLMHRQKIQLIAR